MLPAYETATVTVLTTLGLDLGSVVRGTCWDVLEKS
jgi:hypothetical protein